MSQPDDKHPDYVEYLDVWQKCRDATKGQRAIRAATTKYLPLLAGQSGVNDPSYVGYIARANYVNATGRTVDTMAGMVFRKDMKVEIAESIREEWLGDITLTDETLQDFAETAFTEMLQTERPAILVDMPEAAPGLTAAQAQQLNQRPYLALYKVESIINWEMARINGAYWLKNVWLAEKYRDKDGKEQDQIRQLTLDNGVYEQVIWQKGDAPAWKEVKRIKPLLNGTPFKEIPFYPLGKSKPTMNLSGPPIESLADVNIAHYLNSVDLEHVLHMASIPTLFITGHQAADGASPIALGSSTAVILPEAEAKAQFVQCGTEGIMPMKEAMQEKLQQMAMLGSRIMAPEKKQAEAAETANIRRGSENSVLASASGVLERQLEKALNFAVTWAGIADPVTVELNRDYVPWNIGAQELTALVAARQSGEISKEMFFNILQYAELVDENLTFEEAMAQIESDGPPLGTLGKTDGGE